MWRVTDRVVSDMVIPDALPAPVDVRNKRVVITGAGRGLGRVIATAFARSGATVGLVARSEDRLRELADSITNCCRAVDPESTDKAIEAALASSFPHGIIDRVVKVSNGVYECHNITVYWPHHIFVTRNFKVVGAF